MTVDPLILPIGFFFGICSLIGVTGNTILLITLFRTKRLRSSCHILIGINFFADLIHECGQFPFVYTVFTESRNLLYENVEFKAIIKQKDCYWILFVPLIGVNLGTPMILAMGIDRIIAIVFPAKYRFFQEARAQYICAQMIFPITYTIVLMFLGWKNRIDAPMTACAVPVGLMGSFQLFTYSGYVLNLAVIFLYLFAAYELKKKGGTVFISISITVGFVVFGWMATTFTNTASMFIFPNDSDIFYRNVMQQYAGITVNIATSSNFFVFYWKNAEYREAIKKLFGLGTSKAPGEPSASMTANLPGRKQSTVTIGTMKRISTHSVIAVVG